MKFFEKKLKKFSKVVEKSKKKYGGKKLKKMVETKLEKLKIMETKMNYCQSRHWRKKWEKSLRKRQSWNIMEKLFWQKMGES